MHMSQTGQEWRGKCPSCGNQKTDMFIAGTVRVQGRFATLSMVKCPKCKTMWRQQWFPGSKQRVITAMVQKGYRAK